MTCGQRRFASKEKGTVAAPFSVLSFELGCRVSDTKLGGGGLIIIKTRFMGLRGLYSSEGMHAQLLQSCPTLSDPMNCSLPSSSVHRILPGKNPGVGCHALLQGIFLTQGSNLALLHGRQICER